MRDSHTLFSSYLQELEALLVNAPDDLREDVLAGVKEHVEAQVEADWTEAAVSRALVKLGSPQAVAAEALADAASTRQDPSGEPARRHSKMAAAGLYLNLMASILVLALSGWAVAVSGASGESMAMTGPEVFALTIPGAATGWLLLFFYSWAWPARAWLRLLSCVPVAYVVGLAIVGFAPSRGWAPLALLALIAALAWSLESTRTAHRDRSTERSR